MKEIFLKVRNTLVILLIAVGFAMIVKFIFGVLEMINPILALIVSIILLIFVCYTASNDIFGEKK